MPCRAWGTSYFADDIRNEVGGKLSVMGIYQMELIVQTDFPVTLAKFAIFTKYSEEENAFSEDMMLTVYIPGAEKPVIEQAIPRKNPDDIFRPYPPEEEGAGIYTIVMPMVFSPLRITEPGFIKVRMQCGDVVTKLGRLMVRKARPEEQGQFES